MAVLFEQPQTLSELSAIALSRGLRPDPEWLRARVDELKELGILVVTDVAQETNVAAKTSVVQETDVTKETESQCEGSRPNSMTFSLPVVSAS